MELFYSFFHREGRWSALANCDTLSAVVSLVLSCICFREESLSKRPHSKLHVYKLDLRSI